MTSVQIDPIEVRVGNGGERSVNLGPIPLAASAATASSTAEGIRIEAVEIVPRCQTRRCSMPSSAPSPHP